MQINNLSDFELLNIIIGKNKNCEVVNEALASYSSMPKLILESSGNELSKIKGIGKSTINKIEALKQIMLRINTYEVNDSQLISKPQDMYELVRFDMSHMDQEVFRVICLNTKNRVIHIEDVFKGTLNTSLVHPREVFKLALKYSAASIIVAHNHPSGKAEPSKEDINITVRLKECGTIMGIELLDHIIVGSNKFVSLKEKGII